MRLRTRLLALGSSVLTVAALGLVTVGAASASTSVVQSQDLTITDASSGCYEVFTVSEHVAGPTWGNRNYVVDAQFTKNPCGLTNGLEAGLKVSDISSGFTTTAYGADIHNLGVISEVTADANTNWCDKYGARWWNGSAWQYYWYTC